MKIQRKWAIANKNTFSIRPIKELILSEINRDMVVLDPFANNRFLQKHLNKSVQYITNDINPECDTDYHLDANDFLNIFDKSSVDMVLYDPPYSPRQVSEVYKQLDMTVNKETTQSSYWSKHKNQIARIIKPGGKVISFGWNSGGVGKKYGFKIEKILLVAHGGHHNDTICTVDKKVNED